MRATRRGRGPANEDGETHGDDKAERVRRLMKRRNDLQDRIAARLFELEWYHR